MLGSRLEKTCFVISPIGEEGSPERQRADKVLKHIIAPAIKQHGYEVIRADHISAPGLITPDIITHLVNDPLVIADLTDHNPNVFYELALRHAARKPVIQIISQGNTIPFDLAQSRTIHFNLQDLDSVASCREEISRQLIAIEDNPQDYDNPISTTVDLQLMRQSDKPLEKNVAEMLSLMQSVHSKLESPYWRDVESTISELDPIVPKVYHVTQTSEEREQDRERAAHEFDWAVLCWGDTSVSQEMDELKQLLPVKFPRASFQFIEEPLVPEGNDPALQQAHLRHLVRGAGLVLVLLDNENSTLNQICILLQIDSLLKHKTYLFYKTSYNFVINTKSHLGSLSLIPHDHRMYCWNKEKLITSAIGTVYGVAVCRTARG